MQVQVWEADTADFHSRKRAARACLSCQKRKKRCPHTFTKSRHEPVSHSHGPLYEAFDAVAPTLTHKEHIRFVGDLNPESILTDLSARSKDETRQNRQGTWVSPPDQHVPNTGYQIFRCRFEKFKIDRGRRVLSAAQKLYLEAVGAFRVLPRTTQDALVSTYFTCIDELLPLVDSNQFLHDYKTGAASMFLIQAMCMVTCKIEEATPFLRLSEAGPLVDPMTFAKTLHAGLDVAMKADLEPDRVTKVQILALMSMNNDGPGGLEDGSLHLAQAIHEAQTAGAHIHTTGRDPNDQESCIWWCLWMFDKLNACIGGRPLTIADRDVGLARPNRRHIIKYRNLAAWLPLADLLDQVICYYRPIADQDAPGWEQSFPTYDELTREIDLESTSASHQNALEIFYNISAILACRSGGPSTVSYARRISAANKIQEIMLRGQGDHVPPLPMIPYAAGLSLTVAYRSIRDKKAALNDGVDMAQVCRDLAVRCEILERLSTRWFTADAMARLGRKALASLQQPSTAESAMWLGLAIDLEVAPSKPPPPKQPQQQQQKKRAINDDDDDVIIVGQHTDDRLASVADAARAAKKSTAAAAAAAAGARRKKSKNTLDLLTAAAASYADDEIAALPTPRDSVKSGSSSLGSGDMGQVESSSAAAAAAAAFPLLPSAAAAQPLSLDMGGGMTSAAVDQFQDLDAVFGDFFDLAMPTFFQDPLFEPAGFFDLPEMAE